MLKAFVAAVAFAFLASPGSATTFISFNGSTGVFGNDLIDSPIFDDVIDLGPLAPGNYLLSATITSNYQTGAEADQDIDFTSVMFNGQDFEIGSTGQNEFRFINSILTGNSNLFTIKGMGGANSSYSGTINVAAIPEPTTWAMILIGFLAIGSALRRRAANGVVYPQAV